MWSRKLWNIPICLSINGSILKKLKMMQCDRTCMACMNYYIGTLCNNSCMACMNCYIGTLCLREALQASSMKTLASKHSFYNLQSSCSFFQQGVLLVSLYLCEYLLVAWLLQGEFLALMGELQTNIMHKTPKNDRISQRARELATEGKSPPKCNGWLDCICTDKEQQ